MKYTVQKFTNGMHFLAVSTSTANKYIDGKNRRALCIINKTEKLHVGFMPKKDGNYFITIGAMVLKKLHLKNGDEVTASFEKDDTTYQFNMPEELQEVLDTDDEANKIFHSLTDGNKRGIIYLVTLVKSSDKKIERALKIADKLKAGITSPRLILK